MAIGNMGRPGHWVPVCGVECGKRPRDSFQLEPLLHIRVLSDVVGVVQSNKIIVPDRVVGDERDPGQRERQKHSEISDSERRSTGSWERSDRRLFGQIWDFKLHWRDYIDSAFAFSRLAKTLVQGLRECQKPV